MMAAVPHMTPTMMRFIAFERWTFAVMKSPLRIAVGSDGGRPRIPSGGRKEFEAAIARKSS